MRFTSDEALPGTVDEVLAAFVDLAFLAELQELSTISAPEVLSQERDGDIVRQRLRYRFTGSLSSAVTRVIDREKLVWVDEHVYDLGAHQATFRIIPEHYANRFDATGTERFEPIDTGSRWVVDADLQVRWPLVGRLVEGAIVSGLRETLAGEAVLLGRWLSR